MLDRVALIVAHHAAAHVRVHRPPGASLSTSSSRLLNRETLARWVANGSAIAVAIGVMNLATYAFTALAARFLGPEEYGQLAALMGLLLVVNVVSLGLQATAARRLAAHPGSVDAIEVAVRRATWRAALLLGALLAVLSPLVERLLRLDSLTSALLLAATAVPLTVMGGQAGLLQGERRWTPLALLYVGAGVGRLALGLVGIGIAASTVGAMAGVAAGAVVPVLVGAWGLRRRPDNDDAADDGAIAQSDERVEGASPRAVLIEIAQSSHALLAFFVLSNVDVLVARAVLPDREAGLYAAGLIMTKAVLFLPQFVVVLVFPSLADESSRRRLFLPALGAVLAIGLTTVAGVAVLRGLAQIFVGGEEYAGVRDQLWLFAILGTVLAMLQLIVYQVLAQRSHGRIGLIWLAVAALVPLAVWATDGESSLLAVVLTVDVALLGTLVALVLRSGRRPQEPAADRVRAPAAPEPEPASPAPSELD